MNVKEERIDRMVERWLRLGPEALGNLKHHLKNGTRVLCGAFADFYVDEPGGG